MRLLFDENLSPRLDVAGLLRGARLQLNAFDDDPEAALLVLS